MRIYRRYRKGPHGAKVAYPKWWVELRDHDGIPRRLPAFTDKAASVKFGERLEELVNLCYSGGTPAPELAKWLRTLKDSTRMKLAKWEMLDVKASTLVRPLANHVDDYHRVLLNRGRTDDYADGQRARLNDLLKGCRFNHWRDIDASKVEQWLAGERKAKHLKTRTSNHYVTALKALCTWMVKSGRCLICC